MLLAGGVIAAVSIPLIAQQRPASGPIARYDMRAATVSGMGAMGGGMGMMFGGGGGNRVQRELWLRIGSTHAPDRGAPKADHFMPPAARLGKSVPLRTPGRETGPEELPQRPKGRILLFWGCGERAPRGQPVVIDFARIAAGQMPPGLWNSTVVRDWGPTLTNSRTFARWPHGEDNKPTYLKSDSSLLGAHKVAGNYSPEMNFTVTRDFMAGLTATTARLPTGATRVSWTGIPLATGYLAEQFAAKLGPDHEPVDLVMWNSSATRMFGGGLADWLTPAQVATLIRDRAVMPPSQTSCVVPAEVRLAGPDMQFGTLTAFGPMEEFAYPPRPADARTPWNLEWTARLRYRSLTTWMEAQGMSMGAQGDQGQAPQPQCNPRRGGLGGILGGAIGVPGGC